MGRPRAWEIDGLFFQVDFWCLCLSLFLCDGDIVWFEVKRRSKKQGDVDGGMQRAREMVQDAVSWGCIL